MKGKIYKIVVMIVVVIVTTVSFGSGANVLDHEPDRRDAGVVMQEDISYSATYNSNEVSTGENESSSQAKDTVKGLLGAGFSVKDIVSNLKNFGKNAAEISVACLSCDIAGGDIYNALLGSGFSQEQADGAIPKSLRNETLSIITTDSLESAEPSVEDNILEPVSAQSIVNELVGTMPEQATSARGFFGRFFSRINKTEVNNKIQKATDTMSSMLRQGYSVSEITDAFVVNGFSQTQVAKVLNDSGVTLNKAQQALIQSAGADNTQVANDLISAGYNKSRVFNICSVAAKNDNKSAVEVVETLAGKMSSRDSNFYKSKMYNFINKVKGFFRRIFSKLFKRSFKSKIDNQMTNATTAARSMLISGYSHAEISDAFAENGYSTQQVADILKGSGISTDKAYAVMATTFEGASGTKVTKALINAGYKATSIHSLQIIDLKAQGKSAQEVIDLLIGSMPQARKGLFGKIIIKAGVKAKMSISLDIGRAMLKNGYEVEEVTNVLATNGFDKEQTAKILYNGGAKAEVAYEALSATGDNSSNAAITKSMVNAGYNKVQVNNIYIADMKAQGKTAKDIISDITGIKEKPKGKFKTIRIRMSNRAKVGAIEDAAKSMLNNGYTSTEIVSAVSESGYNKKDAAKILRKGGVSVQEAFSIMQETANLWGDINPKAIMDTLISVGYNKAQVYDLYIKNAEPV